MGFMMVHFSQGCPRVTGGRDVKAACCAGRKIKIR